MRRVAPAFVATIAVVLVFAGALAAAPQQAGCTGASCNYLAAVTKPEPPTATATVEPSATPSPIATPTERPGLPKIKNGDFEQGHAEWTEIPGNAIISQFSGVTPHSGEWLAKLRGEVSSKAEIQQSVVLPSATPLYLHFCAQYTADAAEYFDDFVISAGAVEMARIPLFLNPPDTGLWECGGFDISSFAGQTILLRFHLDFIGAHNGVGLYLDDIAFSSHP
jgi:hypothetical protein